MVRKQNTYFLNKDDYPVSFDHEKTVKIIHKDKI